MKKTITLLLSICCMLMMSIPTFAASSATLTYGLSSGGKDNITVSSGDTITVEYCITASEKCRTATTQNQISYDHKFFELVKGSIKVEQDYEDAFATSNPADSDGTHFVYFNSVSSVGFKSDSTKIGSFKLKVIGDSGSSAIKNTAFFATDSNAKKLGSAKQDLMVTIKGSPKHSHSVVKQDGVAAKEYQAGYKAYYKCSCDKLFEDEDCKTEITDLSSWKAPGGDGYIAPKHKHGDVVKQQGLKEKAFKSGYKDYYVCSCGAYFEDKECTTIIGDFNAWIDKDGNGYIAPDIMTLDTLLIVIIAVVVIGGIICVVMLRRKRRM